MTRTIQGAVQYIQTNGSLYKDGQCEKIVNNAGAFTHAYGLAILSMQASPVPLNPNYAAAPDGVLHYWTNVWGNWPGYGYADAGHVMFGYQGVLWGDSSAITNRFGRYAGSVTKADLERALPWLKYAGWTPYHGPETLAGFDFSSLNSSVLNNSPTAPKGSKVIRYQINNPAGDPLVGTDFFVEESGQAVTHSASPDQTSNLCYRHFGMAVSADVKPTLLSVTDFNAMLNEKGFPSDWNAHSIPAGSTFRLVDQFEALRADVAKVSTPTINLDSAAVAADIVKLLNLPDAATIASAVVKAEGAALANG